MIGLAIDRMIMLPHGRIIRLGCFELLAVGAIIAVILVLIAVLSSQKQLSYRAVDAGARDSEVSGE